MKYFTFLITIFLFIAGCSSEVSTLKKGDQIPNFELRNQDNQMINIQDFVGQQNLVIYFYPKDDTPGCTKQACKFRDDFEKFSELNALVFGISADSPESHMEFAKKHNLPFTLLSDSDNTVRKQFGVKANYLGIIPGRVTFIVDRKGIIQHVFESQSEAEKHVDEAVRILKELK